MKRNCPTCDWRKVEAVDYQISRISPMEQVGDQRWNIYVAIRAEFRCARCGHPFDLDIDAPLALFNPTPTELGTRRSAVIKAIDDIRYGWKRRAEGRRLGTDEQTHFKREGWNACHEKLSQDPASANVKSVPPEVTNSILRSPDSQLLLKGLDLSSSLNSSPSPISSDSES